MTAEAPRNVMDLCRLCLRTDHGLLPIINNQNSDLLLINKISDCLAIKVSVEDEVSQKICLDCLVKIDTFYDFKLTSAKSQEVLNEWLLGALEADQISQEEDVNKNTESDDSSSCESENSKSNEEETEKSSNQAITLHSSQLLSEETPLFKEVCSLTTDIYSIQCISTPAVGYSKDDNLTKFKCDQNQFFTNSKKFNCEFCSYSTNLKCNLTKHIMRHKKNFVTKCNVCEKGFYSMSRYREHTADGGLCQASCFLKCEECGKRCKSLGKLAEHVRIHEPGWRPSGFQCDACGKMFFSKRGMTKHMASQHSGVLFSCQVCQKSLASSESLDAHMRTSHIAERTTYVCSVCSKSYGSFKSLALHEMSHTGERAFPCDLCGKVFTQKSNLIVHKRYHSGDRPFKCTLCDKSFVTKSILKSHEKNHNKNKLK